MNICLIRHGYFPDDPRVRKEALALVEAGHELDLFCLRKEGQTAREVFHGVNIYRIPLAHSRSGLFRYVFEYGSAFLLFFALMSFRFLLRRYDRIQVNTMPDFLVFATLIPKLCRAKIILDLHEPTPELWLTKFGARLSLLLRLQTWLQLRAIKYADACLTVTEALRRRFRERGAEADKITVIPNVCEEAFENAVVSITPSASPVGGQEFRLVTHGLIEERYGHDIVIGALEKLNDSLPLVHYYIYGDGEYRETLMELVQRCRCKERVHFMGFVSFDELLHGLNKADVGIIAMKRSPYSELIDTNKMYEYIALRKPVMCSRLPAVQDTFDDSCMMFFEPGCPEQVAQCITELYHDRSKLAAMSANAYARYEAMRWTVTKKKYLSVVENLI